MLHMKAIGVYWNKIGTLTVVLIVAWEVLGSSIMRLGLLTDTDIPFLALISVSLSRSLAIISSPALSLSTSSPLSSRISMVSSVGDPALLLSCRYKERQAIRLKYVWPSPCRQLCTLQQRSPSDTALYFLYHTMTQFDRRGILSAGRVISVEQNRTKKRK